MDPSMPRFTEISRACTLTEPDEFAKFQNKHVVYHDDIGDYSTNEPTMDGTAGCDPDDGYFGAPDPTAPRLKLEKSRNPGRTLDEGGIVRGKRDKKQLALVFTGSAHGEGTAPILDTLKGRDVKASFFVTGEYLASPQHKPFVQRISEEGHYLGPHSHGHLLYSPWEDRSRSLVTEQEFKKDLRTNLSELRNFGACDGKPVYFIPPYEWYNANHVRWARDLDCVLFNFTPGSGSHRDWAPEGHPAFRPSKKILTEILACEESDPDGLNGHLLLLHLGSKRQDKMHAHLEKLIVELRARGYEFLRVDALLNQ